MTASDLVTMAYNTSRLQRIFDKTGGRCEYCRTELIWSGYGSPEDFGSWEVDHSVPQSKGGTDHLNNLFPACTECNRKKGDMTGQAFRRKLQREQPDPLVELLEAGAAIGGMYLLGKALEALLSDSASSDRTAQPGRGYRTTPRMANRMSGSQWWDVNDQFDW